MSDTTTRDDHPVGWVNPYTGVTYTRDLRFRCALDNYEPPRRYGSGTLQEWTAPDGEITYRITDPMARKEGHTSLYLMDDGKTVRPYYVAGWSQKSGMITLHPMPTDYHPDGARKIRPDNGRPVDMSGWMLGPRTFLHLKIRED